MHSDIIPWMDDIASLAPKEGSWMIPPEFGGVRRPWRPNCDGLVESHNTVAATVIHYKLGGTQCGATALAPPWVNHSGTPVTLRCVVDPAHHHEMPHIGHPVDSPAAWLTMVAVGLSARKAISR